MPANNAPAINANALTASILIEIPKQFPEARVWRQNVGGAYPIHTVKTAISMMIGGRFAEALRFLQTSRVVMFGVSGLPDIDGVIRIGEMGVRFGVEVKTGRDKQNEAQFSCERMYSKHGAIYILGTSVEQVVAELRKQVELRSGGVK